MKNPKKKKKKKGKKEEKEGGASPGMVWPTKIAHCFAGAFPFEHAGGQRGSSLVLRSGLETPWLFLFSFFLFSFCLQSLMILFHEILRTYFFSVFFF